MNSGPPQDVIQVLDIESQALAYFERVERKTLLGARLKSMSARGAPRMHNIADTRSWNLLPAEVFVGVFSAIEGPHRIELELQGARREVLSRDIELDSGNMQVVQFFVTE